MRGVADKVGKVGGLLAVCLILLKPVVTEVHNDSTSFKSQNAYSIISITINQVGL